MADEAITMTMTTTTTATSSIHELHQLNKLEEQGRNVSVAERLSNRQVEELSTTGFYPYTYDDAVIDWDKNVTSGGTWSGGMVHCPIDEGNSTGYGYDFYVTAQMVTGLFIYPAFCFPGLVGNILTVVVLSQRNMLTSTNAFLSALAVSDSIKLINDSLYFLVTLFFNIDPVLGNLSYGYLYPYAHFIFSMSVCVSSWLTVSVAVERYILVCHPTRARNFWSRKRAVTLCCAIYVVMTSLALPSAFRYRTIRCFDVQLNTSRLEVELTEMWQNEIFVTSYTWAQNLLRSIIPLVVLVLLNVCIIRAVSRTRIKKKRKSSKHRVTIMMIVVILAFLICITPDAILSTVFGRGYHEAGMVTKGIREITDTLLTINAAVNFIIYCALNKVFRKSFAHLCCPRSKRQGDGWVTEMDESVYRRFSESKVSTMSSNNNHSARRRDPDSSEFPPSTPISAVPPDGNCQDSNTFRYSTLSGDPSSPESPGFSSATERMAFFTKQDSTVSDGFAEKCSQQKRQNNKKSHHHNNHHVRNSWNDSKSHNNHHQQQKTQKHPKNSTHGLKKSRNSVKCNRGKRMGRSISNNSDDITDNENCGMYHNEAVTYVPKEEFKESLRRVSSGRQSNRHNFPKSNTENDLENVNNGSSEKLNSEKNFVLDLKKRNTTEDNLKTDSSTTSFPLSPDSWPSPPYTSQSHGSPATINSDVIMEDGHDDDDDDDDFQNDDIVDTQNHDDEHETNHRDSPPSPIIDNTNNNSVFHDNHEQATPPPPKQNGNVLDNDNSSSSSKDDNCNDNCNDNNNDNEDEDDDESVPLTKTLVENGVDCLDISEQIGLMEDPSDLSLNGNKTKRRALTVSFSDC